MAKVRLNKAPRKKTTFFRKRICLFCKDKIDQVDYKDIERLRKYVTERGKMVSCRTSGNCAKHQRMIAVAVKRARYIALLSYVAE